MVTYSSYLRECGLKNGESNPFVMTKSEWKKFIDGNKSVSQTHAELEKRLVDCQQAWYNSSLLGMTEDANHAKANERAAYRSLIEFEKNNGL